MPSSRKHRKKPTKPRRSRKHRKKPTKPRRSRKVVKKVNRRKKRFKMRSNKSFESRFEALGRQFKVEHDKITAIKAAMDDKIATINKNIYKNMFVPMRNEDFILQLNDRYECIVRDYKRVVTNGGRYSLVEREKKKIKNARITPRDFLFIKDFSVDTIFEHMGKMGEEGKLCVSYTFQPELEDLIKPKPGETPRPLSRDLIKHIESFDRDPIYVTLIVSQSLSQHQPLSQSLLTQQPQKNFIKLFVSSKNYPDVQNYRCERRSEDQGGGVRLEYDANNFPEDFPIEFDADEARSFYGIEKWYHFYDDERECDEYTWCGLLNKILFLAYTEYVQGDARSLDEDHDWSREEFARIIYGDEGNVNLDHDEWGEWEWEVNPSHKQAFHNLVRCSENKWKNYKSFKGITGVEAFDNPKLLSSHFEEGFWYNFMEKWEKVRTKLGLKRPSKTMKCLKLIPKEYRETYPKQAGF